MIWQNHKVNSPKEIKLNAIGVKSYAIMEQPNSEHRLNMEDKCFVNDCFFENCPKSLLFGVFDGHGGDNVSKYLVKNIPKIMKQKSTKNKKPMKKILDQLFTYTDTNICQLNLQAGSTGTVGVIMLQQSKRVLYVAHVGDSTAYLFDDNNCQKLTPQHRGDNKTQIERVNKNGGKILNNRLSGLLAVTRAFGDFPLKNQGLTAVPEVIRVQLRLNHRFIVVASDGLWDYIDLKTVLAIIKDQQEVDNIVTNLIKQALNNGSTDNISVIVFKL